MRTRITEQEVIVQLSGTSAEMRDLYEELHTWTPAGGWTIATRQFFSELARAGKVS